MKARGALLLPLLISACAGTELAPRMSPDGGPSDAFPVGTYTRCAVGDYAAGWLDGASFQNNSDSLTVEQRGSALTATYAKLNGSTATFDFAQTTATSASLASTVRTPPAFTGSCTDGPGSSWTYPATMDATAGALTYDEGTVFVSLAGTIVEPDAGGCGTETPPAGLWLACDEREGGAPSPEPAVTPASPSATQLPVGDYACASELGTYSVGEYFSGGGKGTLTLTQTGAEVTAAYSGDPTAAGTLRLTATTATTAILAANQNLIEPCPSCPTCPGGGPATTPVALPITAGSLAVAGPWLFLSFRGTMDARSTCAGTLTATTLICSRQ